MEPKIFGRGRAGRLERELAAGLLALLALLASKLLGGWLRSSAHADAPARAPAPGAHAAPRKRVQKATAPRRSASQRMRRPRLGRTVSVGSLAFFTVFVSAALAFYPATGSGEGPTKVGSLTAPSGLGATAESPYVKVEWTASSLSGSSIYAQSYTVERYNSSGTALGAACGGETIPASAGSGGPPASFSCQDSPGEAGTYKYKVTATYKGWTATSAYTGTATTLFGPASKLVFTTQPVGGVTEGANFGTEPVVKVEDAQGNIVTNYTSALTLAIHSGPSPGSLSCTNSGFPTVTPSSGVVSFTGCQITGTAAAGTYTLEATRSGLSATGASSNVVINVGSANKLAFTTQPSGGTISAAWEQQPAVSIEDSYGNVVTTVGSTSITLTLSTGSGTLSCTTNPVSTTSGVSTFAGCKINAAGTEDVLTASGTYTAATSNKFKILATPAVSEVAKGFAASGKTATSSSFTPISGDKYLILAAHTSSAGDSASVTSGPFFYAPTLITSQHLGDNISWQWAWIATADTNSSSTVSVEFAKETTKTGMGEDDNIIEVLQLTNANANEPIQESTLTASTTTSHDQLSANLPTVAAGGSDVVFVYMAGDAGASDSGWVQGGISTITSAATTYEHSGGPETGFGTVVGFAASALSGSATYGHSESWPAPTGTKYGTIALGIAPQTAKPKVTGVSPAAGSTNGGETVTITGENLSYATEVKFGSTAGSSVSVNGAGTELTVTSPAHAEGQVDVTVVTPIGTSATNSSDHYIFDATPTVTSVSPSAGPTGGGTVVTVHGTGFLSATAAKFAGVSGTSLTIDSDTELTVTSPSHAEGTTNIRITNPTGTSPTGSSAHFTYDATPTVTGISPAYGTHSGGTTVTVTGTHLSGAEAVDFNVTEGTSISVNEAGTELTVSSPAHAAGQVNVTVTTPGGTSATSSSDYYTFENTPTVTAVSPKAGTISGATTVTVTGTGFLSATEVKFGTSAGTGVTIVSDTELTVTSPAHSAGEVNVTVVNPYGTSSTSSADIYTYDTTPTITNVSPSIGTIAGGSSITLTGTGFLSANEVFFGASAGTIASINSDTSMTVTSPSHAAGAVNITVTNPHGTSTSTATYTYTSFLPTGIQFIETADGGGSYTCTASVLTSVACVANGTGPNNLTGYIEFFSGTGSYSYPMTADKNTSGATITITNSSVTGGGTPNPAEFSISNETTASNSKTLAHNGPGNVWTFSVVVNGTTYHLTVEVS